MIYALFAFLIIALLFAVFVVSVFYHISRYSYFGDASKRVFVYYVAGGIMILLMTLILIIVNHALS